MHRSLGGDPTQRRSLHRLSPGSRWPESAPRSFPVFRLGGTHIRRSPRTSENPLSNSRHCVVRRIRSRLETLRFPGSPSVYGGAPDQSKYLTLAVAENPSGPYADLPIGGRLPTQPYKLTGLVTRRSIAGRLASRGRRPCGRVRARYLK